MDEQKLENFLEGMSSFTDAVGAGKPTPGCGTVCALNSLIGLELLQTICTLAIDKGKDDSFVPIREAIQPRKKELKKYFVADSMALHRLIFEKDREEGRTKRDYLELLSRIPLAVSEICLSQLEESGAHCLKNGFANAKGDSGTAYKMLLSSSAGCLYIARFNLLSLEKGDALIDEFKSVITQHRKRIKALDDIFWEEFDSMEED